jgi:hypothetical protein
LPSDYASSEDYEGDAIIVDYSTDYLSPEESPASPSPSSLSSPSPPPPIPPLSDTTISSTPVQVPKVGFSMLLDTIQPEDITASDETAVCSYLATLSEYNQGKRRKLIKIMNHCVFLIIICSYPSSSLLLTHFSSNFLLQIFWSAISLLLPLLRTPLLLHLIADYSSKYHHHHRCNLIKT